MEQFNQEQDYDKKLDFGLWKKLLGYAMPFKKNLILTAVFMGFVALGDVVYPLMLEYAIDNIIGEGQMNRLWLFIPVYLLIMLGQAFFVYGFIRQSMRVETGVCHRIRTIGFKKLQELSFTFYDRTPVGYLMARMTSDAQRLADTISWSLVDLMFGACLVVFATTVMFIKNWWLTLVVLSVVPLLAVISVYFQKRILKSYRLVRKTNSQITGSFNEGIMGAKTTKTLVREEKNFDEFKVLTKTMRESSVRAAVLSAIFLPIVTTIGTITTSIALWKGGYDVFTGVLSLGTLTVFFNYSTQMFEPIREIARIFADLQSSQAAAERVLSLIETEPDIVDTPEVIEKYGDQVHPKRENWESITGEVEFRSVDFNYKDGEKVLEGFNLHVKAGQTIALVGETGSGKSTIVNLVCRFYEPTGGAVLIDGIDYKNRSQLWLQSRLGYVLQSPQLFSGTVRENIRYGKMSATDEDVEAAAKLVDAHRFIEKLEKGYDADVGEGGNRLSTGEKQLISFARAILADPAIFVLDEATSSIDTETEQVIQRAIGKVLKGRTSFIVAHRLSTIRGADRILVIQGGKIAEDGTHRELLRKRGIYYNLYTNQFKEERTMSVMQSEPASDAPTQ